MPIWNLVVSPTATLLKSIGTVRSVSKRVMKSTSRIPRMRRLPYFRILLAFA